MNLRKTIAAAGLAAAAMTGIASADPTVIYICGSTAYRAPVTCALINALGGTGCFAAGNQGATVNITKAQTGVLANGTIHFTSGVFDGTATIVVETNWSGSLAGCLDVATQNANLQYADITNAGIDSSLAATTSVSPFTNTANLPTLIAPGNTGANVIVHAPQVAMSDAFLSSAAAALSTATLKATIDGATTGSQLATIVKNAPMVEAGTSVAGKVFSPGSVNGYLGIVPFEWVLGDTGLASVPFSNMTQQAANYLIKNGGAPLTMFATNNAASQPNSAQDFVYLIGRNEDSGTRIDSLAEPGLGFVSNPSQFLLQFSNTAVVTADLPKPSDFTQIGGAGNKVEQFNLWPQSAVLNTETNITWNLPGHGGYAGGGDVASVLKSTPDNPNMSGDFIGENANNAYFLGYLGTADAGGIGSTTIAGGTALTFNGVACSSAAIQNGSYSFWAYEHMYYLTSGAGSLANGSATLTFINNLANSVAGTYATYDNGGAAVPTTDGAGVFILANGGTAATNQGNITRAVEGGGYTLNY